MCQEHPLTAHLRKRNPEWSKLIAAPHLARLQGFRMLPDASGSASPVRGNGRSRSTKWALPQHLARLSTDPSRSSDQGERILLSMSENLKSLVQKCSFSFPTSLHGPYPAEIKTVRIGQTDESDSDNALGLKHGNGWRRQD